MSDVSTGTGMAEARLWWEAAAADRMTVIFGLWLAVAVIYWPSAVALNGFWTGDAGSAYTHGYLVLITSLWLVVRDRARLAEAPIRPVAWTSFIVVLLSGAWLWAWKAGIQLLHLLLLPEILILAVVTALGWRIAKLLLFPVSLFFFTIPIWGAINDALQALSAKMTGILILLSGMPVFLQGDLIRLPTGTIEIAQACAGLNGVVIGLTVAALYGEIMRDPLRRRLVWLALMGAFAMIANAVRIFIVVVAAYETDMRSPLVAHHIWLGWVLFAIAVSIFLLIAGRFAGHMGQGLPAGVSDTDRNPVRGALSPRVSRVRLTFTVACMALLPALSYGMGLVSAGPALDVSIQWPEAPAGWHGPMRDAVSDWSPRFFDPSAASLRAYVSPRAEPIEVFAVAYRTQTQGGKLLGYRNDVLGSQAKLKALTQRIVDSPAGRWRETIAVAPTGARSLIWWRYRIGERTFVQPRLSQLWYGLEALAGQTPVSSLTALRAPCTAGCKAAREQLAAAVMRLQPQMAMQSAFQDEAAR